MMSPRRLWRASDRQGKWMAALWTLGAALNLWAVLIPPWKWFELILIAVCVFALGNAYLCLRSGFNRRAVAFVEYLERNRRNARWN